VAKPTKEETAAADAKAAEEKAKADALAAKEAEGGKSEEEADDFDKDRAMALIEKLRGIEKEHKAKLAEEEAAKVAAAEAEKDLETKLAERDKRIEELLEEKAKEAVKADFIAEATKRGYADPRLALLAAQDAGVLGTADPKTGKVGDHDFEALEEAYPNLAGEGDGTGRFGSGDAGARGKKGSKTPGSMFNDSIRQTIKGVER